MKGKSNKGGYTRPSFPERFYLDEEINHQPTCGLLRPKKYARKLKASSVKRSTGKAVTGIEACCERQFLSYLLDRDPYLLNQHGLRKFH
jgi:hypothetical protein